MIGVLNETYPFKLWLATSFDEVTDYGFVDSEAKKPLERSEHASASTYSLFDENKDVGALIVIYLENIKRVEDLVSILSHEALHVVNMMFEYFGVEYSLDNDEHAAYLLSWVVRQAYPYFKENINETLGSS